MGPLVICMYYFVLVTNTYYLVLIALFIYSFLIDLTQGGWNIETLL